MARAKRAEVRFYDRDTDNMLNFGKMTGRGQSPDDAGDKKSKTDKAIIHQTVPDEVLNPDGPDETLVDRSWLDAMPVADPTAPKAPVQKAPPPKPLPHLRQVPEPNETAEHRAKTKALFDQVANAEASARPRFPYGWLVVVEGPGVGNWFALERGVSHIGRGDGETVQLGFGDEAVAPARHVALAYDETRHSFVLDCGAGAAVRLNSVTAGPRATLRDGDVISLGGTSLRLVAICSQNFHWGSEHT